MVCGRSLCVCFGPKCTHLIVIGFSVKHNLLLIILSFSTIGSISTGEFIWNVRPAPDGLVTDKPELFISFSLIRLTSACSSPAGRASASLPHAQIQRIRALFFRRSLRGDASRRALHQGLASPHLLAPPLLPIEFGQTCASSPRLPAHSSPPFRVLCKHRSCILVCGTGSARIADRILDAHVFSPGGSARTLAGGVSYHRVGNKRLVSCTSHR
jgi:hypothetical protein